MPTDFESILIYLVVLLTLLWLGRKMRRPRGKGSKCGADCGCEPKRHPVIQKVLDKDNKRRDC